MSLIRVPKFSPNGLIYAAVCLHINRDGKDVELKDGVKWALIDKQKGVYARKIIDISEKYWHYHVESGIDSSVSLGGIESTPDEVLTIPRQLAGTTSRTTTWGSVYIDSSKLKPSNFIRALSGISIDHGANELSVAGCTMEIYGDGPFRQLRWTILDDPRVMVTIVGVDQLAIDDDALRAAASITAKGIETFLPTKRIVARAKLKKKKR